MGLRRTIAGWLCPELVAESDRLFRLRAHMSEKIRWLGHDYPMVEVVISRMIVDDTNWTRKIDEKPMTLEYPNLGGFWPPEISAFREKMRRHFAPTPHVFCKGVRTGGIRINEERLNYASD